MYYWDYSCLKIHYLEGIKSHAQNKDLIFFTTVTLNYNLPVKNDVNSFYVICRICRNKLVYYSFSKHDSHKMISCVSYYNLITTEEIRRERRKRKKEKKKNEKRKIKKK